MANWRDSFTSIAQAAIDFGEKSTAFLRQDTIKDMIDKEQAKETENNQSAILKSISNTINDGGIPITTNILDIARAMENKLINSSIGEEEQKFPTIIDTVLPTENNATTINNQNTMNVAEPQIIQQQIAESSKKQVKAINDLAKKQDEWENKRWEQAKRESQIALTSSIASGIASIYESSQDYKANKKNKDFEYQMAQKQIDTQLNNYEAALSDQLAESMANLDVASAAKNVDLNSQAITGIKLNALEDMGKDIQNETTKAKLQKAALNLQHTYEMNTLKKNKQKAISSAIMNIGSAYSNFSSYNTDDYKLSLLGGKK